MQAGIKFYLSTNGVVLTEGNQFGILEPCFFEKVEIIKIKTDQLLGPAPAVEDAVEEEHNTTDTMSSR